MSPIHRALSLASLVVLSFVAGTLVILSETFPHRQLENAYRGGVALHQKLTQYDDVYRTDLWHETKRRDRGVTVYHADRTHPGLTLYTSGHAAQAFLISMEGTVAHEWKRPYSSVWDETAAVSSPQPDSHVFFRKAHLFANGDLLALYEGVGDSPYGYGIVKLDRASSVLWKYLEHAHHDFDVADDGRIYGLIHEFDHEEPEELKHLETPRIEDFLVVLSPDGQELDRISLFDAVVSSPYRRLLHAVPSYSIGDPLHANAVDFLDEKAASRLPFAEAGQVLVSFRELAAGTIAVLDLSRRTITWAYRGPWLGQHDPDVLPDGRMLVFDNNGAFGPGGRSRVLELDPVTGAVTWSYAGDADHPFESRIRASQEPLANGNVLVTESSGGRLFEVTRDGRIVWEFLNPIRGGASDRFIPVVCWGQRVSTNLLETSFRELLESKLQTGGRS